MKKIMFVISVVAVVFAASASAFVSESSVSADTSLSMAADHEHKPCHATKSSGGRCDCRDCCGNNWGNYYCTRCNHKVDMHY